MSIVVWIQLGIGSAEKSGLQMQFGNEVGVCQW